MYEEKIKMAAIFYLIGMIVYLAWLLLRNHGIKGFRETIDELSEDYPIFVWDSKYYLLVHGRLVCI